MFILVFLVLMGTVVAINDAPPVVDLLTRDATDETHIFLLCGATGFNTEDIVLNIKKNHCAQTKEDGVETEGVKPNAFNIFWRGDHVEILKSEVSRYSCEVSHAASHFRVEKVWDPDSDGKGRIISSKFIDTTPPHVKMFPENSEVQTNVIVTCLVSGFYPNNIILNMKRNGRILTREDGVKSSGVCSYEDGTFQRRDSVEIKRSDTSDYSCEVIHDASGSRVEKFWDHRPPLPHSDGAGDKTGVITGPVVGGVLVLGLILVVVLYKKGFCGAARCRTTPGRPLRAMASRQGPGGSDLSLISGASASRRPATSVPDSGESDIDN
ncbi:RT1 class I histocompatibility antigen, AA alpha chain-like [Mugil cephalus]|uniref:RT1 class I histocompatibility antigen, AA alpha chain-like n=1 Tax=Mugil cephalus TaxID=48193 RepID=UPI001FB67CA1|nr:RT1 class I histocompatibility antigen, AA alpha chain-like [Mugil cephalus]